MFNISLISDVKNESFVVDPTDKRFKIDQERFKCAICNYTSRFKQNVRRHERRHLTESPRESHSPLDVEDSRNCTLCDQCGKPFKTKHGLKLHVNSKHLNIFRFKCSVCSAQFNMKSAFQGHLATHRKELKAKCSECGAEFQYKQSLKDHKKNVHNIPKKKKYVCDLCDQNFSCRDTLLQHRRGMHGGKAFDCPKCDATYRWRTSLAYHMAKSGHSQ